MAIFNHIEGATVTATDIRKSWSRVLESVKASRLPAFVFTNNTPEAVVLSYETYQAMAEELEQARREKLGQQMLADLQNIAELTDEPTVSMVADAEGVFYQREES